MKLEVAERIAAYNLLPKEGDYAALKVIRRAREVLLFTPQEIEFLEMKSLPGADGKPSTTWSKEKAKDCVKDIPLDEYITSVIRDALADLNRKKKLSEEYFGVYEKFVVTYK